MEIIEFNYVLTLPGSAPDKPNIYDFSTTYHEMYQDLAKKDKSLYTQNGILHMLDRNRRIKPRPERCVTVEREDRHIGVRTDRKGDRKHILSTLSRFQNTKESFDIIFTAEERVYDQCIESLESRGSSAEQLVHVINLDIQVFKGDPDDWLTIISSYFFVFVGV